MPLSLSSTTTPRSNIISLCFHSRASWLCWRNALESEWRDKIALSLTVPWKGDGEFHLHAHTYTHPYHFIPQKHEILSILYPRPCTVNPADRPYLTRARSIHRKSKSLAIKWVRRNEDKSMGSPSRRDTRSFVFAFYQSKNRLGFSYIYVHFIGFSLKRIVTRRGKRESGKRESYTARKGISFLSFFLLLLLLLSLLLSIQLSGLRTQGATGDGSIIVGKGTKQHRYNDLPVFSTKDWPIFMRSSERQREPETKWNRFTIRSFVVARSRSSEKTNQETEMNRAIGDRLLAQRGNYPM